jgi:hypothetical protein
MAKLKKILIYESLLTIELYNKQKDICIFGNQHIQKMYYICLLNRFITAL